MRKLFSMALVFVSISQAQIKEYYASIYEGESVRKAFKIKLINDQLIDTIYVIYSLVHDISDPRPQNVEDWKKEFARIEPLRVKIDTMERNGNNLSFITSKFSFSADDWFNFSFVGRMIEERIVGTLTQVEYEGWGKKTYTDEFKVTFSQ